MTKVDLHIHSTYSDSSRSPEEIVKLARARDVSLISICDHAATAAYDTLPALCREYGVQYVVGVELGALWNGDSIHMLAYGFDLGDERMRAIIDRQHRAAECEYIVYNMMRDYPQMSLEEYRGFRYPKDKGGWKYLYYAAAKGAARTYEEANLTIFRKYSAPNHLSDDGDCDMKSFCDAVRGAGGVPVLAHPGYLYRRDSAGFCKLLRGMQELGLGGVECYYPSHSAEITRVCLDYCKRNDLRITAGCDCHGDFDKSDGFTIGALEVPLSMLDLKGIL